MDARVRIVYDEASKILGSMGLKFAIVFGGSHPHVVVIDGDAKIGKVSFSTTPRSDNKNFFRQNLNRLLKKRSMITG